MKKNNLLKTTFLTTWIIFNLTGAKSNCPGNNKISTCFSSDISSNYILEDSGESGEQTDSPTLPAPVAVKATNITHDRFTANWTSVEGATEYELYVYTKQLSSSSNLIANPGFETGTTNPWHFESAMNQEIVTNIVKSGTYALKTSVTTTKNLNQSINVENGKEYKLSFWYYIDNASTGKGFRIWITNGATVYLPGATNYFNIKNSWQYIESSFITSADLLVLNFRIYNGCTLYLDNIRLTYEETEKTAIEGSPFSSLHENSKTIEGLSSSTEYYYQVKAKNANITSDFSNEESVTTDIKSGINYPACESVYVHDNKLYFYATQGEQVEIYNTSGQKIINMQAIDGLNIKELNIKGIMIVKIGNHKIKKIKH